MTPDQIAIGVGILGAGVALGQLSTQRRTDRRNAVDGHRRAVTEFLASVAALQGAVAGHRRAWESPSAKAITLLHAMAAFRGHRDLSRGTSAAAPIAYTFFTEATRGATSLSVPLSRVGTAVAQIQSGDDQRLAEAASALYAIAAEAAARPHPKNRRRLEAGLKVFGEEARRSVEAVRVARWRRWLAGRLVR